MEPKYLYDIGFHSRETINEYKALIIWDFQDSLISFIGFGMFFPKINYFIQISLYIKGILIELLLN